MEGRPLHGISIWHPAVVLATWFGSGCLPKVPGTWGSLAALPFAWVIQSWAGPVGLVFASVLMFLVGWWASSIYCRHTHEKDPRRIVVDEVAAQWLTLAGAPLDPVFYAIGFVLFRIADIVKPWPANRADRELPGGLGVMADDMLAGIYSLAATWALAATLR